jgi:hypothetical protein
MTLWEFSLECDDATAPGQTVITEGTTEVDAVVNADILLTHHVGAILLRPGRVVPLEIEKRWREVSEAFPIVVSDTGRLALYARGIADPTFSRQSASFDALLSATQGSAFGRFLQKHLYNWVRRCLPRK